MKKLNILEIERKNEPKMEKWWTKRKRMGFLIKKFTHGHTWSGGKVAIIAAPGPHLAMPKHSRMMSGVSGVRTRNYGFPGGNFFARIPNVNFPHKPLEGRRFHHGGRGSALDSRETVNPGTEPVTWVWLLFWRSRVRALDDRRAPRESGLTCPDFVALFWKISTDVHVDDFFVTDFSNYSWKHTE